MVESQIARVLAPPPQPSGDGLRRGAFLARILLALLLVAALPVGGTDDGERLVLGLGVALVFVPITGLLEAVRRRRPGAAVDAASFLTDAAVVAWVLVLLPDGFTAIFVLHVFVVAYHSYVSGRGVAVASVLVAGALALAGGALAEPAARGWELALLPVVAAAVAVLMYRLARAHRSTISDLGRVREKALAVVTGVAQAVVVTSPKGRVLEWNAAAARTFDCDDAVGRSCADALALRQGVSQLDCSEGCALLGADTTDDDVTVWRSLEGEKRQALLANVSPIFDDAGQVVEIVHSLRDISRLVEADEAKTLFLATATHELKTPLTVIMGFSELLQRRSDLTDGDRGQALTAIQQRARQLTGIVDRLLMSSRIEAGQITLEAEPVDLEDTVHERVREVLASSGRAASIDARPGLAAVAADPGALVVVVDQLLDNAVKYSNPDARIDIVIKPDREHVVLSVTDAGIGMTGEEVARCTDRFWQAEIGDIRRYGGTGIGLYIVKALVEAMHGELVVRSAPGAGSTFSIALPLASSILARGPETPTRGQPTLIGEFMRQAGVGRPQE